jgi:hypothetical protein
LSYARTLLARQQLNWWLTRPNAVLSQMLVSTFITRSIRLYLQVWKTEQSFWPLPLTVWRTLLVQRLRALCTASQESTFHRSLLTSLSLRVNSLTFYTVSTWSIRLASWLFLEVASGKSLALTTSESQT